MSQVHELSNEEEGPSEDLLRLAGIHGVAVDYWNFSGQHITVSSLTIKRVLAALGVDASTPESTRLAVDEHEIASWRAMLPPISVVRLGQPHSFPVHVAHGAPVTVWIELDEEAGGGCRDTYQQDVYVEPRMVDGRMTGRATFALPVDLPLGWHKLHAHSGDDHSERALVVVPSALSLPEGIEGSRGWGFMTQLYSLRSGASWGIGDLADLGELSEFSGRELGADFVLINPLHAPESITPLTPSPYLPTTRRFVSPLYIRVEDIRETAYLSSADRSLIEWQAEPVRALNESPAAIDRDVVWTAKKAALEIVFEAPRSVARDAAFARFRSEEGQGLEDFALWCALVEERDLADAPLPEELASPRTPGANEARERLARRIEFYCWLQWIADEQLEAVQRAARDAGMALGIMHDLAVGVHAHGADAWSLQHVLATGIGVGAPPDMYNQQGQNWSQPPLTPTGLADAEYRPYRDMLRTILRHAGAVRIDHILGLFRLWWIPDGQGADEGTYVRYDHEALVGILCLEAHRAGAVVIGEDLGVVEPWVREYLSSRGILGTSILWFEKDWNGDLLAPEHWRRLCLATITTHDLPPTAGYLAGEHIALRERLGLLTVPVEQVRAEDRREQDAMFDLVKQRGLLPSDPSERQKVEALHAFMTQAPSVLLGVALTDAVGERRAQNQPGTDTEYPNWKLPLCDGAEQVVLVEDLASNARLRSLAEVFE